MRQNLRGRQHWSTIKWTAGTVQHNEQKDSTSCGVFVMQVCDAGIAQQSQTATHDLTTIMVLNW